MGFRDELEASRARVEALDHDVARLRREKTAAEAAAKTEAPPFAVLSVVLFFGIVALALGVAFQWERAEGAEADARRWRQMEGETAVELQETRQRLVEAQREDPHPPSVEPSGVAWFQPDDERSETWQAVVSEHIGDAPTALGATCVAHVQHVARSGSHESAESCALRITCDDALLYPRADETDVVQCYLDPDHRITSLGRFDHSGTRALGTSEALRIDDGPNGAWSLLLRRLR